ncbi:putative quinol monooxygenase [Mesorhizobium sp. SB112]|uniref:putative quinol monooxygenase n=1 Tax=Mesorhizobium sp. SB112 TaxID=3151853 RepID=UPI003267C081
MSVTYLIRFKTHPEKREKFLRLINGVLDAMRHEQSFISATLHRDPADAHGYLLHETWQNRQDVLNVQLKRDYRNEWHDALPELLQEPRDISVWEELRSDNNRKLPV